MVNFTVSGTLERETEIEITVQSGGSDVVEMFIKFRRDQPASMEELPTPSDLDPKVDANNWSEEWEGWHE